jgi:hypothetical protein
MLFRVGTLGGLVPIRLAAEMTMHAHEGLLQKVIGSSIIFDPAADEGFQPVTVLMPHLIQWFIHQKLPIHRQGCSALCLALTATLKKRTLPVFQQACATATCGITSIPQITDIC